MKIIKILWYYLKTRYKLKFKTRAALERWQDKKVKKFLNKIIPNSPFYLQYYKNYNLNDWQKLPEINKNIMIDNFDALNTRGITKEAALTLAINSEKSRDFSKKHQDIIVGLSSGTSGNKGIFLVSSSEQAMWTGKILAKVLPNCLWQKHRIAFFYEPIVYFMNRLSQNVLALNILIY